jgi:hypothetical protein
MSALLENLRRICGDANVLTHDDPHTDLSAWEQDWRKRAHGKALAVVRPANVQGLRQRNSEHRAAGWQHRFGGWIGAR